MIRGGGGDDLINGGDGDDDIYGNGDDLAFLLSNSDQNVSAVYALSA